MTGLSTDGAMLLQATWMAAITITTLGILWNARGKSIYAWFISGCVGVLHAAVSLGPIAESLYPSTWGQTILGVVLIGGVSLKTIAIKLLTPDSRADKPIWVAGAMVITVAVMTLLEVSRPAISVTISFFLVALVLWIVRDVFSLGRTLQLTNAKIFGVAMGFQAVMIFLATIQVMSAGIDPFVPLNPPIPISDMIFRFTTSLINNAIFIALILDLNIRQRQTIQRQLVVTEIERSRLTERQELLADMHDGFGSQLITAKMQAEKGALSQSQLVDVLQECMSDLYVLLDGLKAQTGDLTETLKQYRHRIERRLVEHQILLLWQINLHDAPPLSPKATINLLRIVQEAIHNALKHANARKIIVSAYYSPQDGFTVRVEDDGRGMPTEPSDSQGLASMRRRARQMGARLNLRSGDDGTGTIVELSRLRSDH